ncbi:MAG: retropepsin-like aspartic protease [bacterium]|nr:retropepsin-like aspartic protease [bacterium]
MLLDTGASSIVITPDVADELGYDLSKVTSYETVFTASKAEKVPKLELTSVILAGEKATGMIAKCMNLPKELKVDGLLGLNFLRCFKIYLDFEKGILTFDRFRVTAQYPQGE